MKEGFLALALASVLPLPVAADGHLVAYEARDVSFELVAFAGLSREGMPTPYPCPSAAAVVADVLRALGARDVGVSCSRVPLDRRLDHPVALELLEGARPAVLDGGGFEAESPLLPGDGVLERSLQGPPPSGVAAEMRPGWGRAAWRTRAVPRPRPPAPVADSLLKGTRSPFMDVRASFEAPVQAGDEGEPADFRTAVFEGGRDCGLMASVLGNVLGSFPWWRVEWEPCRDRFGAHAFRATVLAPVLDT